MDRSVIKMDRLYHGQLLVTEFAGKTSSGEKRYGCLCACGTPVQRTVSQLSIRRLQSCQTCRAEHVEDRLAAKSQDRLKNHRRVR